MESKKIASGVIWKFAERIGAQLVNLVVSIVLARLILPNEFGTVTLTMVFINILNVFVESGLPYALVQKKEPDDIDFSTVFYFNVAISLVLYVVIFVLSPLIANFYNQPILKNVTRVLSIMILIAAVKSVQNAYVSKKMIFKKFFICTLIGTICSAVVGISMAYLGYGVWAIVFQQLTNTIVDTIMLWIFVDWKPKKLFSFERLKELFSFGWKLFLSSLLDVSYNNLRSLLIGKVYSTEELAFYDKGNQFPQLIVSNINTSIDSALLPAMSSVQEKKENVKQMTRQAIKISSYIMWPLMLGLFTCAKPLICLILTHGWLNAVPYLRIFCLTYVIWPIHTANLNAIKAIGRSDWILKLEIIKKVIGLIMIGITLPFGPFAIAIGFFISSLISAIINAFPNKKLLDYSLKEQIMDILPYIVLSLVMMACIWPIQYLEISNKMMIFLQVFIGAIVYLTESIIFKVKAFYGIIKLITRK